MNRLNRTKFKHIQTIALLALLTSGSLFAQTISRILDSGTIKIGYRTDTPPLSFQDKSGKADGYSVAICKHVAESIKNQFNKPNLKIVTVPVNSEDRFTTLIDGNIDILCGASSITLSRRESMLFSIPVFLSGMGAVVHQDVPSRLKALLSGDEPEFRPRWRASYGQILKERTLTVLGGTTSEKWLRDEIKQFNIIAKLDSVGSYQEGIEDVLSGKTDVLFGDRAVLINAVNTTEQVEKLKLLDRQYSYEAIALAMQDGDKRFNIFVDRVLSRLYESGEIEDIYIRYFGEVDSTAKSLFTRAALPE